MSMSRREEREKIIVGYGINQKGACDRDGSLGSYDYQFNTFQKAEDFERDMKERGYGDTIWGIEEVTLQQELDIVNYERIDEFTDKHALKGKLVYRKSGDSFDIDVSFKEFLDTIRDEENDFVFYTESGYVITFKNGEIEID